MVVSREGLLVWERLRFNKKGICMDEVHGDHGSCGYFWK